MAYSPLGGQHPRKSDKRRAGGPLEDETVHYCDIDLKKLDPQDLKENENRTSSSDSFLARYIIDPRGKLIIVQRGNPVITTSRRKERIEKNLCLVELATSDFNEIEEIARTEGQVRFGNWDEDWGSDLFAVDVL